METETDWLTGLMNRRVFLERLEMATGADAPLSVLLLGLDRFAHFNCDFTHAVGDDVLCRIARFLQQNVRDADMVSRYGGDGFAIMLPQTALSGAKAIAEQIRMSVAEFPWSTQAMTVSIGAAWLTPEPQAGRDLMDTAEKAMHEAKMAGGNCVRPA